MENNMREMRMNFWRHKTNEANRGFFPTSLDVVELEMDLIDFSEVKADDLINICDLTAGTGEQLNSMHNYMTNKNLNPTSYYNEVTKERFDIANNNYGHKDNFHLLQADIFNLKVKTASNKKAFTIIRNNPPYGYFDYNGSNVRMEDIFFMRNAEHQVDYGIHIFELPIHQLVEDKHLIRKIFYRYENISIFLFPKQHFDKKQICLIGSKKPINTNDIPLAEEWRRKLANKEILSLDEVDDKVIKLDYKAIKNTKPIELYRDGKVSDTTLTNGFNAVFKDLVTESTNKFDNTDLALKVPMIEQLPGHVALDIYSGQYDGLIGDVLVKGGVKKGVKTMVENEGNTQITTEIEVIYPFIEITSANGTSFIKEHNPDL